VGVVVVDRRIEPVLLGVELGLKLDLGFDLLNLVLLRPGDAANEALLVEESARVSQA